MFIRLFLGSLPFSGSSFDMKWLRIPLLCKERVGEVESLGYQSIIIGSTIEGSAEAISLTQGKNYKVNAKNPVL
jgi:hypothetical protein